MNFKNDFPIFKKHPKLAYLDSAATSQKPQSVVDAMTKFYREQNANIHRGIYELSEVSTKEYDTARTKVAKFIGAKTEDIIFVRNATEGINLVAYTFGNTLKKGDTVLISIMEHHANFVPWLELKKRKGIRLEIVGITEDGQLDMKDFAKKLKLKPKLVAITHVSNALGTINPVNEIISKAKKAGAKVLIDACQSIPHMKVDVSKLKPDFLVFSGHKMFGPTGIGVLYVPQVVANKLPPFITGGDMIQEVTTQQATFLPSPQRFEAGTPNISGAIGLGAALDYINYIGIEKIRAHEKKLFAKAWKEMSRVKGITLYGPANTEIHSGVISFNMEGVHPHDIAQIFDDENIAIRAGHHCAEPLMKEMNLAATARISFSIYNDESDIERVVKALNKVKKIFS